VAERVVRPCGFPPAPALHGPTSRSTDVGLPHRTHGRRLESGHAPPVSSPPVFRYPHSSHRTTRPGPVLPRPRRRSWGSTLRGVAPARGCRDVSAPRTHLPFFQRPVPFAAYVANGTGRPTPSHPHWSEGTAGRGHRPRLLGFVPAGGRPRVVRHGEVGARHRGHSALGFSSLRCSDAGVENRFRPLPLVGFADVPDVMRPAKCSARRRPRGRRSSEWP